jgi:hypothetical protein
MSVQVHVAEEAGPVPSGFNWGAFLFTGIFLLFNRRIGTAILLGLGGAVASGLLGDSGGAVLGICSLLISLYYGFAAKQIAWETGRYETYAELERSMRKWNVGAFIVLGVLVVLVVLASLS